MKLRIIYIFLIMFFFSNNLLGKTNIFIKFKVDDEIITNQDIINERNYLISLNNNLKELPKSELEKLSTNSLIKEKIKKKELLKYFDFDKAENIMNQILQDLYTKMGFVNEKEFEKYLINFDLKIEDIKEKLKIETLWNQLIFDRFNNRVSINKEELKNKLKKEIEKNKNLIEEYSLSEILFNLQSNETLESKYNKIIDTIETSGFKNTSNIYGISESAKFGGKIGWVKKTQLTEIIIKEINKINIGQITSPIQTSNGYLVIKLDDKRKIKKEINFNEELNKLMTSEKNRKLNEFSLIYFNKIKQNVFISDL